ncbi:SusC/RagA family TonB-linked outer membrane protein [Pedobacter duraquae]|uniref:TonB-linked SusC/RagA family outer membrane protein n=1 Tax=Pedobacter duraquae TaxID=425511 RepID=A0A4R6IPK6_9SPHI|nr:TonB-dependent receptor [Pedobacter duraquae]TDO24220.1 TonB-linked SusC/RagA family outer membrane protein [Pedobacter duraquae]
MNKGLLYVLLLLLFSTSAWAQTRLVTGRVVGKNDEILVGVTITIKGSKTQTSSDQSGKFKINVPSTGKPVLVASYIGVKPVEITVGDQSEVLFEMKQDDENALQEVTVVNIGYGTVNKNSIPGAVSSVSARDLKDFPVATAAEALAGKLAGVSVITSEGKPGADIQVRVRGGGSITQDNSPLYIVDGVQVDNALSVISPQEIESIDVLKDVASTAIYGARGANGVVLITTKSGKNSRTVVSFSAFGGVRKITNSLDVLKPYDFVMYQYQLYNNNTDQQTKDAFTKTYGAFSDLEIYKNVPFTDWQDRVFGRDAQSYTQNLTINGGTKTSSYNLNVNNYKEDGIMLNSGAKRTYVSFRFDNSSSEKFRFGFNARYSRQMVFGAGTSNTGSQSNNSLRNAVRYRPYDEPGQTTIVDEFDPDYANLTNLISPVLGAYSVTKNDYNNQMITSAYAQYTIIPGLSIKTLFGITNGERRGDQFNSAVTGIARQNANMPVVTISNGSTLTITNTNTINYDFKIKDDHKFNFLLGQEINQSNTKNQATSTKWLPVDLTAEQAFAGIQKATPPPGGVQDAPTTSQGANRLFSVFGRASYTYKDKYLASVIVRNDASSLFAPGNRDALFPSAQVSWRLTEEPFVKGLDLQWLSSAKIRASYGAGGNNRIGTDLWKVLYLGGGNYGYAVDDAVTPGFAPNALANPNIKWETTVSRNLGLDLNLFNSRLTATFDMYKNNTKDLLLLAQVPVTTGWSTQQQNIGATSNRGMELQLAGAVVNTNNFSYNINFNISFNRNKIESLGLDQYGNPNSSYSVASGGINGFDFLAQVGGPIGQFYGYVADGRYELSDFDATFNSTANSYSYKLKAGIPNARSIALGGRDPQPGDMKLKKLSGAAGDDITEADKTVLGNAFPKFAGGINQQFTLGNFDASVFMNFSIGNKTYNANKTEFTGQYLYKDNNMLGVVADRWKMFDETGVKVTDPAKLAALNQNTTFWTPPGGQYILTSYAIEDGSFLRVSNVTLGYSLPQKFLSRTKVFSRFRVYATVNNLYTFTKYSGYDPEANTRRGPLTPGVDYAAYPRSRYVLAGIDVSF